MNYETKRDVFVNLAEDVKINDSFDEEYPKSREDIEKEYKENIHNYDAAFPDNLPVIPKAVGEYIKSNRTEPLGKVFWHLGCISVALLGSTRSYIVDHSEVFARAWVLGIWHVEETGEIVKLED